MALNLSVLTTWAQCDEVLAAIAFKLASYQNQNTNIDYADTRSEQAKTKLKAQLEAAEAEITMYTNALTQSTLLPKQRAQNETKLRKAIDHRDNLADPGAAPSGPSLIMGEINAEQVDAQVAVLTNAQTKVTAHRATLTA